MSAPRLFALSIVALLVTLAATGCDKPRPPEKHPTFAPRTSAPPLAITEYVEDRPRGLRSIRLTEGVAMALECWDESGAPCLLEGSTLGDERVASFRRAYGDFDAVSVSGRGTQRAYLNRAVFVVVARQPGEAKLVVQTGKGPVTIDVTVFPQKR
ncbi:MAG: hypothetical protein KF819_17940 [Labilithrix sp.]|nr:hypothetical protein [Labilithrix sp.]